MQNSSSAEVAVINVLKTFEAAGNRYWPTAPATVVDAANSLVEDYESGKTIDWALALDLIVNFHIEMGEWIGSH